MIEYLCQRLEECDIDVNDIIFQTDNGEKFVSDLKKSKSLFENMITEKYKAMNKRIHSARLIYNGDVESSRKLTEDEVIELNNLS